MGSGPISNYQYSQIWWVNGKPVVVNFYSAGNGPPYQGTEAHQ